MKQVAIVVKSTVILIVHSGPVVNRIKVRYCNYNDESHQSNDQALLDPMIVGLCETFENKANNSLGGKQGPVIGKRCSIENHILGR